MPTVSVFILSLSRHAKYSHSSASVTSVGENAKSRHKAPCLAARDRVETFHVEDLLTDNDTVGLPSVNVYF